MVGAWQSWAPNAPDELWSKLVLLATVGGLAPTVQLSGAYLGSAGDAANLLDQLYAAVGSPPSSSSLSDPQPFLSAMLAEAGCSTIGYQACHLPWYASGGMLGRQAQFSKSDFFTAPLSGAGIGALMAGVAALQSVAGAGDGIGGVQLDSFGGAVNRVRPGATAFVHRNALFMAQYTTDWYTGATAAGIRNQHAWLRTYWSSMRSYASGQAYQNYVDPDLANWRQAYYGRNYPRLAAIKQKYDPAGLFTFPQAITPVRRVPVRPRLKPPPPRCPPYRPGRRSAIAQAVEEVQDMERTVVSPGPDTMTTDSGGDDLRRLVRAAGVPIASSWHRPNGAKVLAVPVRMSTWRLLS